MPFLTVKQIRDKVLRLIGQVPGSSVQTYTEPMLLEGINQMFEYLFNKREWEHIWNWRTATLDGVNGVFTTALTGVLSSTDIRIVKNQNTEEEIVFPSGLDYLRYESSTPKYRTELAWNDANYEGKFFKFYPVASLAPLLIYAANRPAEFAADNDIVPMEGILMTSGVAWYLLADDGMNPASAAKQQGIFDTAYNDIVSKKNATPIGHGQRGYRGTSFSIAS